MPHKKKAKIIEVNTNKTSLLQIKSNITNAFARGELEESIKNSQGLFQSTDDQDTKLCIAYYTLKYTAVTITEYQLVSKRTIEIVQKTIQDFQPYLDRTFPDAKQTICESIFESTNPLMINLLMPYVTENTLNTNLPSEYFRPLCWLATKCASRGFLEITEWINENNLDENLYRSIDFKLLIMHCIKSRDITIPVQKKLITIDAILELKKIVKNTQPIDFTNVFEKCNDRHFRLKNERDDKDIFDFHNILTEALNNVLESLIENEFIKKSEIRCHDALITISRPLPDIKKQLAIIGIFKKYGLQIQDRDIVIYAGFGLNFKLFSYVLNRTNDLWSFYNHIQQNLILQLEYVKFILREVKEHASVKVDSCKNAISFCQEGEKQLNKRLFPIDKKTLTKVLETNEITVLKKLVIAIIQDLDPLQKDDCSDTTQLLNNSSNIQELATVIKNELTSQEPLVQPPTTYLPPASESLERLIDAVTNNKEEVIIEIGEELHKLELKNQKIKKFCTNRESIKVLLWSIALSNTNIERQGNTLLLLEKYFNLSFLESKRNFLSLCDTTLKNGNDTLLVFLINNYTMASDTQCFLSTLPKFEDWYSDYLFKLCKNHITKNSNSAIMLYANIDYDSQIHLKLGVKKPLSWLLLYKNQDTKKIGVNNKAKYISTRNDVSIKQIRTNHMSGNNIFVDLNISIILVNVNDDNIPLNLNFSTDIQCRSQRFFINETTLKKLSSKLKSSNGLESKFCAQKLDQALNEIEEIIEPNAPNTNLYTPNLEAIQKSNSQLMTSTA